MAKLKIGVLISGRGSNLQALIEAASDPRYPAEIALVISNRADAAGLVRAQAAAIATEIIPHRQFPDRAAFDTALDGALRKAGIGLVCLAGFMRILTPWFAETWRDRLINIHPSLLPAFKGLDPHAQALAAGVRFSGCTVHFVTPEMDSGPIIIQAAVPVLPADDEATLAARILTAEHRCYPLAVRLIAEGRVHISGGRVLVDDAVDPGQALLNPKG
jgi:phosphoribosylglycinamide formyltransferase-1